MVLSYFLKFEANLEACAAFVPENSSKMNKLKWTKPVDHSLTPQPPIPTPDEPLDPGIFTVTLLVRGDALPMHSMARKMPENSAEDRDKLPQNLSLVLRSVAHTHRPTNRRHTSYAYKDAIHTKGR